MSSKWNIYCCVPGGKQKGTVDPEGNRVGFFGLPNDQTLRKYGETVLGHILSPHYIFTKAT